VTIEAQHLAKKTLVERAVGAAIPPVASAGPAYGYRDRAKLAVGAGGLLGFHARRSHDLVDVEACLLFGPELARALPALRALARGLGPGVELDVQAGRQGVHLNVVRADPTGAAHARREVDRLAGAGVVGLALAGKPTWGLPEVDVAEPEGAPLAVPAGGFAQVGRAANAALVRAVLEAVGPSPGIVRELYAGSGTLTRALAARGQVFAEDGDPAAVERGRRNAPAAAWARTPARPAPDAPAADTVVLDPPREGADRAHLDRALAARRRVVYVSCDPQTLGRDARALLAGGFRLARAVALDLMPQTFHVEVVATFDRA
jgi:23S rRNA (uracil1939-C5)-methyltransferase